MADGVRPRVERHAAVSQVMILLDSAIQLAYREDRRPGGSCEKSSRNRSAPNAAAAVNTIVQIILPDIGDILALEW